MTTKDFITKAFNGTTRATRCSSVFVDGGDVYSYGYHYPLLFRVGGLTFINTSGYSSTTQRHIMWAKQAVGYDYISVELPRGERLTSATTLERMQALLGAQLIEAKAAMDKKTRKDTQTYKYLEDTFNRIKADYDKVRAAL